MTGTLKKYFKGDPVIWAVILLLSLFSLLAVYSSTGSLAYKYQGGNTGYYIFKHATILLMGLVITYATHLFPYKYFAFLSRMMLIISIVLLLFTLFWGIALNQGQRWLVVPVIGLTIQPSDLAKLAIVMYAARILSKKQETISDFKGLLKSLFLPLMVICGLVLPSNLSTSMLIFATVIILMFIGRVRILHIMAMVGIIVIFLAAFIGTAKLMGKQGRIATWEHRLESFFSFLSNKDTGEEKVEGENYQVTQAKIALVSGGLVKIRPGKSMQRNFLPHPYSDFIYAIIIEEYGLVGGIIILALYLYLLFRAAVLVKKCQRNFQGFLVIGLAIMITFQAITNMAVVANLLPVTGQPLPMISMGGSSLLFTCIAFGIIQSVSRGVKNLQEEAEKLAAEQKTDSEDHEPEIYN